MEIQWGHRMETMTAILMEMRCFYELENHWHDPWSFWHPRWERVLQQLGPAGSDVAERNYKTAMAEQSLGLEKTDPELEAMMKGYIYGDIMEQARLTRREQHLVTIATLTASGAQDLLERMSAAP